MTLIQGHMGARKQKHMCQLSHKVYRQFWWHLVYFSGLLVWWILYSLSLSWPVLKGENPANVILSKNFSVGLYSDISWPISFKLGMMIETTELFILTPDLDFIQGHSCMRNQKCVRSFSGKHLSRFWWDVAYCHTLFICWSSCMIYIQGRGLCLCDIMKCTFSIGLFSDTCEPISFKLGMMLDSTIQYDSSLNDLDLYSRSHRDKGKLELMQSICCEVA